MPGALKALGVVAAYAVTVAAVAVGVLLTAAGGDTPWPALLVAMAIVHLGFGIIVARWSAALLPLAVSAAAVGSDLGGFSITTLLVGVPCTMLVFSGTALRIGWDGGGQPSRRRDEAEAAATPYDDDVYYDDADGAWPDAGHAA